MSYAWTQLQAAMRILAAGSDRRERLAGAYGKLIKLKPKDLPAEVTKSYTRLLGQVARFPAKYIAQEIRAGIEALSDEEVTDAIDTIAQMYLAVAAYQPRPVPHPRKTKTSTRTAWPLSATLAVETQQSPLPASRRRPKS